MKANPEAGALAPFLLEPLFVERIWGTADLRPWYNHVTDANSDREPIGEVWLNGDKCKLLTGTLTGRALGEVFAEYPHEMLGPGFASGNSGSAGTASPLLLKVIFAKEKLSVQVHPDDRMARKYREARGKTECWYALAAAPGAKVAAGLRPGVTLESIEQGVADGTLEGSLSVLPVEAGDMIYVDAGAVHAIWPGSVLLETQQNSDTTYRLYDYGRPRELHLEKALEAIRFDASVGKVDPKRLSDRTVLVDREYFCVEKINVDGMRSGDSMRGSSEAEHGLAYLFAAEGSGRILAANSDEFEDVTLPTRALVAVPASSPAWKVEDLGGLELIRITPRGSTAIAAGATEQAA